MARLRRNYVLSLLFASASLVACADEHPAGKPDDLDQDLDASSTPVVGSDSGSTTGNDNDGNDIDAGVSSRDGGGFMIGDATIPDEVICDNAPQLCADGSFDPNAVCSFAPAFCVDGSFAIPDGGFTRGDGGRPRGDGGFQGWGDGGFPGFGDGGFQIPDAGFPRRDGGRPPRADAGDTDNMP